MASPASASMLSVPLREHGAASLVSVASLGGSAQLRWKSASRVSETHSADRLSPSAGRLVRKLPQHRGTSIGAMSFAGGRGRRGMSSSSSLMRRHQSGGGIVSEGRREKEGEGYSGRTGAAAEGMESPLEDTHASSNEGDTAPARDGIDFRKLLDQFWSIASPYWMSSPDRWQGRIRLMAVLVLTVLTTGVRVVFSFLGRDFFNALESRNQQAFVRQLVMYLGGYIVGIPVFVFRDYLRDTLALRWRAWMTQDYVTRYMGARNFYNIQTQSQLDNPDQRINEDVSSFTSSSLSYFLSAFDSVIDLISFSGILFSIYPPLFGVVFAYAAAGTLISAFLGKALVGLNFLQEKKEADFRYGLVRVRENAESIAFYGGEQSETKSLLAYFNESVSNYMTKLRVERNLSFFTVFYQYLIQLVPVAVLASLFFKNKIEFGVISQASSAFNNVLDDCSMVVYRFESLSAFSAVTERLGEFKEAIEGATEDSESSKTRDLEDKAAEGIKDSKGGIQIQNIENNGIVSPEGSPSVLLRLEDVSISTPSLSSCLLSHLTLTLSAGQPLLLVGPSGSGKTSVLRAIAGLWKSGSGTITRIIDSSLPPHDVNKTSDVSTSPEEEESTRAQERDIRGLFFLPQKPYMVLGSLRDQLLYPTWSADASLEASDSPEERSPEERSAEKRSATERSTADSQGAEAEEELSKAQLLPNATAQGMMPPLDDAALHEVLSVVKLGSLVERWEGEGGLSAIQDWSSTLSLGEQQRIAFARLLLSRPILALLDEATSALDEDTEGILYKALTDSGINFVSVGHRKSLRRFHKFLLRIQQPLNADVGSPASWALESISE